MSQDDRASIQQFRIEAIAKQIKSHFDIDCDGKKKKVVHVTGDFDHQIISRQNKKVTIDVPHDAEIVIGAGVGYVLIHQAGQEDSDILYILDGNSPILDFEVLNSSGSAIKTHILDNPFESNHYDISTGSFVLFCDCFPTPSNTLDSMVLHSLEKKAGSNIGRESIYRHEIRYDAPMYKNYAVTHNMLDQDVSQFLLDVGVKPTQAHHQLDIKLVGKNQEFEFFPYDMNLFTPLPLQDLDAQKTLWDPEEVTIFPNRSEMIYAMGRGTPAYSVPYQAKKDAPLKFLVGSRHGGDRGTIFKTDLSG